MSEYPFLRHVPPFDPTQSLLAGGGLSTATLQQWLAAAQLAYFQLTSGGKVVKASYTQGDGMKSVEYTPANITQLTNLIMLLQSQLGVVCRARRPIRFFTA